jgi:SsrA-binding protein
MAEKAKAKGNQNSGKRLVAQNKKAYHDYFIEETYECGIELTGTEVKSVRQGKVNLKDSFASVDKGEVFAYGVHISPYEQGNRFNTDPMRPKKLLLHKREIMTLLGKVAQQGYSLVPTSVYFVKSKAKLELALAKGKKLYDKREDAAKRDAKRDIDRALKDRNR